MDGPRAEPNTSSPPRCGRYELLVRIGKGGMASVYLARVRGEAGFTRLYALKVLHPHLSEHQEFVDMLMDEAKIASRLHHPHVVSTVDIGRDEKRYFLVMDYVEGVALDRLMRRHPDRRPPEVIVPIAIDALRGLHAAHQLTDENGKSLELVHRDVTPGNVIVGVDGTSRIADFGVAKARARITKTHPGIVKGKAGYIAPEVVLGKSVDGRADVFSMGVMLWNALTGQELFDTDDLASTLTKLVKAEVPPPSEVGLMPPAIFDAPILGALHREAQHRHDSALEMAQALEDALMMYGRRIDREAIGAWVQESFGPQLAKRRQYAASAHGSSSSPSFDSDPVEAPSASGLVRKGPAGDVSAMPEPGPDDADDPFAHTMVSEPPSAAIEAAQGLEERVFESGAAPEAEPETARSGAGIWIAIGVIALLAAAGGAAWWWMTRQAAPREITATPLDETPARPAPAPEAPAAEEPAEPVEDDAEDAVADGEGDDVEGDDGAENTAATTARRQVPARTEAATEAVAEEPVPGEETAAEAETAPAALGADVTAREEPPVPAGRERRTGRRTPAPRATAPESAEGEPAREEAPAQPEPAPESGEEEPPAE